MSRSHNLRDRWAGKKLEFPEWPFSRQGTYLGVAMLISLSSFKLIAAAMLLVGMKWLADWHLDGDATRGGKAYGV